MPYQIFLQVIIHYIFKIYQIGARWSHFVPSSHQTAFASLQGVFKLKLSTLVCPAVEILSHAQLSDCPFRSHLHRNGTLKKLCCWGGSCLDSDLLSELCQNSGTTLECKLSV